MLEMLVGDIPIGIRLRLTDAGHRNPLQGGLGMNSGLEDALALSWRLSAIIKGYGGPHLIPSYEAEQRPTMITRLERCNCHVGEHGPRYQLFAEQGLEILMAKDEKGDQLRKQITIVLALKSWIEASNLTRDTNPRLFIRTGRKSQS